MKYSKAEASRGTLKSSRFIERLMTVILITACILAVSPRCGNPSRITVVHFGETDSLIANPGQGWMTMQRSPQPGMRFPYSVVYRSFLWADAEPEQGKINWNLLDSLIVAWKPFGATIAFRVMTTNPHSRGYYSSPKWLFDEGCKGYEYLRGGGTYGGQLIPRIEPDYSDPIYLKHHDEFIAALGKRYDGDPNIEFIDIGSYGMWGEWHTSNGAPLEVRRHIVDSYLKAFKKTQLIFMSDGAELLQYGFDNGTGMRRDGVGSTWHEQNWIGSDRYANVPSMEDAWKHAPVIFEWYGRYDYLVSQGWSFPAAINFILRNHATIINDNVGEVPPEEVALLKKVANRAGARLVLLELTHQNNVKPGGKLSAKMKLANVGVGKIYYPYVLRLYLLNDAGQPAFSANIKTDPRNWLPGEYNIEEEIVIPDTLAVGEYSVALALEDSEGKRRPFHLAIDAPQEEGRQIISKINVK